MARGDFFTIRNSNDRKRCKRWVEQRFTGGAAAALHQTAVRLKPHYTVQRSEQRLGFRPLKGKSQPPQVALRLRNPLQLAFNQVARSGFAFCRTAVTNHSRLAGGLIIECHSCISVY